MNSEPIRNPFAEERAKREVRFAESFPLLDCPFCNEKPVYSAFHNRPDEHNVYIRCHGCGISTRMRDIRGAEHDESVDTRAVLSDLQTRWNSRVDQNPVALKDVLKVATDAQLISELNRRLKQARIYET